jgi:hypothetical protein
MKTNEKQFTNNSHAKVLWTTKSTNHLNISLSPPWKLLRVTMLSKPSVVATA